MSLEKAKSLFVELVANVPPDQWDARLAELSGGDTELRLQVNRILDAHRQSGSFLESPAPALTAMIDEPIAERPGTVIGPYKLLEQIGEGGFGVVFVAEQQEPVRRKVALKLIKPGMDTRQVIARFEAERQALAIMDHPNIAKVFDAGATESGRPYFVMELVPGIPITDYCDQNRLTPRDRLDLFVTVCHAVQHAHQKGIIHRDIKPSNVLVSSHDGRVVTKVIDFGVAKAVNQQLTERTVHTQFAQMIGTPLYMSPEQAEMSVLDIDTRSDIYSLGVLLYELLTGTTPFDQKRFAKAAYDEIRRVIREEEPDKPSSRLSHSGDSLPSVAAQRKMEPAKLSRLVRGDLDWITMKALEKDRTRRYETANGFAMDVQRYLADEPVLACPPSAAYRLRKFVRRNKGPVLAASVIALLLVGGIIGTTWQALRAMEAERSALALKNKARANFELAKDAVEKYLNKVTSHKKLNEKDFLQLRKELLETAVPFYQKFVEERSDEPELEAARGRAYSRLALARNTMGDREAARADWEATREIFAKLAADFPGVPAYRRDLAASHISLGGLLTALRQRVPAEAACRAALNILEQLAAEFPNVPEHRHTLAMCHNNLAQMLAALAKHTEAEEAYRASLKIRERLVADFPDMPEYRQQLARSHNNLGVLLEAVGQRGEAESAYRAGVKISEQLAGDFLGIHEYRHTLAVSNNSLASLLAALGHHDEAEAAYRAARTVSEPLANDSPSVPEYRHTLAMSHINLGTLLRQLGKRGEAELAYRAGLKHYERLAGDFPSSPQYRQTLAIGHINLAGLLKELGQRGEAEAAYRSAFKIFEQLAGDFPSMPEYRQALGVSHNNLGILLTELGKHEEAEAVYRAGLKIREQLTVHFPEVPGYAVDLGNSYANFANLIRDKGERQASLEWYAKAIATLEPVVEKEKRLLIAREYLRNAHWGRAIVLHVLIRHREAIKDWDRAIQLDDGRENAKLEHARRLTLLLGALYQDCAWPLLWGWPRL